MTACARGVKRSNTTPYATPGARGELGKGSTSSPCHDPAEPLPADERELSTLLLLALAGEQSANCCTCHGNKYKNVVLQYSTDYCLLSSAASSVLHGYMYFTRL